MLTRQYRYDLSLSGSIQAFDTDDFTLFLKFCCDFHLFLVRNDFSAQNGVVRVNWRVKTTKC